MRLFDEGAQILSKPKVVHVSPGRIRFQLPLLKRLGKNNLELVEVARRLLEFPDGIDRVAATPVTGSLLIQYDRQKLMEKEVKTFINSFNRVFIANRENLTTLSGLESDEIFTKLVRWLGSALQKRLYLDPNQRISLEDLA